MTCEECGKETNRLVILPLKSANGNLNKIVCLDCAKKSPAYCKKHQSPHLGFMDGSTACVKCIEALVESEMPTAESTLNFLKANLPPKEFENLLEWADQPLVGPQETCVLRFLATKALRSNKTVSDVLWKIVADQSVYSIVPHLV